MPHCNLLYHHMCTVLPGYYKPCCQYTLHKDYKDVRVDEMTHTEYVNMPQYQKIREDMKSGWNAGCEKCRVDEESNKLQSLRQVYEGQINSDEGIRFVEISLSNYCNLSCKMCNPYSSSKWADFKKKHPDELSEFYADKTVGNINVRDFFKDVNLKNLKELKYLGGEPFITPQTKDLFNFLEDKKIIQNVSLLTNTNCTFYPEKWIKQLLKFKRVGIGLSIDGFEKSCEYSRTGSKWDTLKENALKWAELAKKNANLEIYFSTTINAFTVHDYHKLTKFAKKLGKIKYNPYVIHSPYHLRLEALPLEYIESIKNESNEQFLRHVKFDPILFERLKTFVKTTDKIQNIDIKDYIPELAKYLTET